MNAVVTVESLRVELTGSGAPIVDDISFSIGPGEVFGMVGESGSGKTTIGTALLGHARSGVRIAGGRVLIDGVEVLSLAPESLRDVRGRLVAYVPQDPSTALNPALRIGRQLLEVFEFHDLGGSRAERMKRVCWGLAEVGLPGDDEFLGRWPHQLSGGQQQRVCLAMAFLAEPRAIVLDEPTTGLDVTTQARILGIIRNLCGQHHAAALYITHDLAVVSTLADRVLVLYAGRLAEVASRERLFSAAAHPYTAGLLASIPEVTQRRQFRAIPGRAPAPGSRPLACSFAPRCSLRLDRCATQAPPTVTVAAGHQARCHRAGQVQPPLLHVSSGPGRMVEIHDPLLSVRTLDVEYRGRRVVHGVDLDLLPGECVALVGESGSGKTTLSRAIVGLLAPSAGRIELAGDPLPGHARQRSVQQRRAIQYIFQNPYGSLNPRHTIGEIVGAPLRQLSGASRAETARDVEAALDRVGLEPRAAGRYPDELSGGERQRVAIARALACRPDVLICDEITSALDVSVQAAILDLLQRLQADDQLTMLFVTHNLALVRSLAARVAVLRNGALLELAAVDHVLDRPRSPYAAELIRHTPTLAVPTGIGPVETGRYSCE